MKVQDACVARYGGHTLGANEKCARCKLPKARWEEHELGLAPAQPDAKECEYEHCPSPAFIKNEGKPRGHMQMPDGRAMHFACYFKAVRAALLVPPAAEVEAENERRREEGDVLVRSAA